MPVVTKPPFNPSLVAVAPLVAALLGGMLSLAFGAPGWCYLLVVVVGIVPALIMAGYVVRALLRSRQAALAVPAALEKYQPEFAVFYATKNGATYQLGMWLPYLERLDQPFVVITRNPSTVPTIATLTRRRSWCRGSDTAAGQPRHAGGALDEGRVLRPGQPGQPHLPALQRD